MTVRRVQCSPTRKLVFPPAPGCWSEAGAAGMAERRDWGSGLYT